MTFTKLHYGVLVAAGMLVGGAVSYYNHDDRPPSSVISIEQVAALVDGVLERQAAISDWPFTTNGVTSAGWLLYGITNIPDAQLWNFNPYWNSPYTHEDTIPLFGSVIPRMAINQSLVFIKSMVPSYVDYVTSSGTPVYLTVTGLFDRLNIGDGTNKWTIGVTTNRTPVYGTVIGVTSIGSTLSTVTLNEAWACLNAMTTTARVVDSQSRTQETYAVYRDSDVWPLENVTNTSVMPPGAIPPLLPNWIYPSGSFYDYPTVAALGDYAYSEISSNPVAYGEGPYGGQFLRFHLNIQGRYTRELDLFSDVVITDDAYAFDPYGTNKIILTNTTVVASLAMPNFPTGVIASVLLIYEVEGEFKKDWPTNDGYFAGCSNVVFLEEGTNIVISAVETQTCNVAFTNILATGFYTNVVLEINPQITNYISPDLLVYTMDDYALSPPYVWNVTNYTEMITYIFDYYPTTTRAMLNGSLAIRAPRLEAYVKDKRLSVHIVIINWTFKYH